MKGIIMSEQVTMNGWEMANFALSNNLGRVLMYGLPGTGKTYFGLNYHLNGKSSYRLICTEEMTDSDLIGGYRQSTNGTWQFREGVGIKAWREGARLVVDEINRCNSDVESRLMALIDTTHSSRWEHPETGEIVTPSAGFSVVATMNGEPEDLAPAVLDRLVVQIRVDEPHPDAIMALPNYLREIAQSFASRNDIDRYSLRNFVEFASLYAKTNDLERSALVALPRIAEQMVDALAISNVEAR
jgi:MoxR-like ATPase